MKNEISPLGQVVLRTMVEVANGADQRGTISLTYGDLSFHLTKSGNDDVEFSEHGEGYSLYYQVSPVEHCPYLTIERT